MEWDFNEKALLRAEVRLSRAEAELMARSLRWVVGRDLSAAHERGEGGPSLDTLRTVEAVASVLEGATLPEAAKRSEEAWTGNAERDRRRAAEGERRAEGAARRELGAAGADVDKMALLGRVIEGAREGRTEFSAEEVGLMRAMLDDFGGPYPSEELERLAEEQQRPGENN